ncbi:hypothetical protein [Agromyces laixinhei]|uniref:hypothetical protein n=1 Tax=Agromyces laixinhei TaxID=2585717 RepID=UPI0012EEAEE6|nr:hypothetical protein [Agromyces laixinhei]
MTNSNTPDRKVAVGGAAGAVTILVVWLVSFAGVEVPAEVASAFTVLVTFAAAYFTPRKGEHEAP